VDSIVGFITNSAWLLGLVGLTGDFFIKARSSDQWTANTVDILYIFSGVINNREFRFLLVLSKVVVSFGGFDDFEAIHETQIVLAFRLVSLQRNS
jgi:hypothetical protein